MAGADELAPGAGYKFDPSSAYRYEGPDRHAIGGSVQSTSAPAIIDPQRPSIFPGPTSQVTGGTNSPNSLLVNPPVDPTRAATGGGIAAPSATIIGTPVPGGTSHFATGGNVASTSSAKSGADAAAAIGLAAEAYSVTSDPVGYAAGAVVDKGLEATGVIPPMASEPPAYKNIAPVLGLVPGLEELARPLPEGPDADLKERQESVSQHN